MKRWRAGPASFQQGIDVVAGRRRAARVVGIKIADELGYHDGLATGRRSTSSSTRVPTALRVAAPGKLILVDIVVPELGCLPGYQPPIAAATACAADQERNYRS